MKNNLEEEIVLVYSTFPDKNTAQKIGKILVQEQVAACINILGDIHSIYQWDGNLEENQEVATVIKTTSENYSSLEVLIKKHHPYDCPCIIGWSSTYGAKNFFDWIKAMVK